MKTWDAIYQEWQTDDGQIHAIRMGLLIRCKDCRHWVMRDMKHLCEIHYKLKPTAFDFCSYAERSKDE